MISTVLTYRCKSCGGEVLGESVDDGPGTILHLLGEAVGPGSRPRRWITHQCSPRRDGIAEVSGVAYFADIRPQPKGPPDADADGADRT